MAKGNRFTEQLEQLDNEGGDPGDGETGGDAPAEKPARRARTSATEREAPPPRRNAAAKPAKPSPRNNGDDRPVPVVLEVDGERIAIPAGSPVYARALKIAAALLGD